MARNTVIELLVELGGDCATYLDGAMRWVASILLLYSRSFAAFAIWSEKG